MDLSGRAFETVWSGSIRHCGRSSVWSAIQMPPLPFLAQPMTQKPLLLFLYATVMHTENPLPSRTTAARRVNPQGGTGVGAAPCRIIEMGAHKAAEATTPSLGVQGTSTVLCFQYYSKNEVMISKKTRHGSGIFYQKNPTTEEQRSCGFRVYVICLPDCYNIHIGTLFGWRRGLQGPLNMTGGLQLIETEEEYGDFIQPELA